MTVDLKKVLKKGNSYPVTKEIQPFSLLNAAFVLFTSKSPLYNFQKAVWTYKEGNALSVRSLYQTGEKHMTYGQSTLTSP